MAEIEARTFVEGAWYVANLSAGNVEIFRNTVWLCSGRWKKGGRLKVEGIALEPHITYAIAEALENETEGMGDEASNEYHDYIIQELERVQLRVYEDAEKTKPTADSAVLEWLADGSLRIHDNQGTQWIGDPDDAVAALGTVADQDWPAAWEALKAV